jgi:hypothetical protein
LTVGFREYLLGGLGPDERVGAYVVPAVDEGANFGVEFGYGVEDAATDRLALDDAEPALDEGFIQDAEVSSDKHPAARRDDDVVTEWSQNLRHLIDSTYQPKAANDTS